MRLSAITAGRPDVPGGRGLCRSGGEDAGHVDPDARAHRAGDGQRLQVLALGAGRLRAVDRVDEGRQVVEQLLRFEARPTERRVDDRGLVDAELDAAALDLVDRALDV